MKKIMTFIAFALVCMTAGAQADILLHSHNDYVRTVPFWQAYAQKMNSIEADVYCVDGKLLIGHDPEDLRDDVTFEELYVKPLLTVFGRNGGRAWKDSDNRLQLMVELKSPTEPTLSAVVDMLGQWPEVFDPAVNEEAVRVVITGNVPSPDRFADYPEFIFFDGSINRNYTPDQLARVALFSEHFTNYSRWNGKGSIVDDQEARLYEAIDRAHSQGKPIRFWGAPESVAVYYVFYNMGIDFINTDRPEEAAAFFSDWGNKNFLIGGQERREKGVTGTSKLDKATRDFSGFKDEKLYLSKGIDTYEPTFRNDGSTKKIKNIIYLIGDGMGLNQVLAGYYANKGLTVLNMKATGLGINCAADEFTTDSAAGGSALATGVRHKNRGISSTPDGEPVPSLSDWFHDMGKSVGVVTLGNVADATPSAFYGHSVERDSSDIITNYLREARIDLLCGSGLRQFTDRNDGSNLIEDLKGTFDYVDNIEKINDKAGKVICLDERMDEAAEEANLDLLADAVRESIEKLQGMGGKKGFFLMVEAAKIDYAGHSRCLPGSVIEMLSFDLAIAEALKFADENGETLVVVTADHETGGLMLIDGDEESGRIMGAYFSDDHTPSFIPVFAYGPGSSEFCGTYMNIEVPRKIKALTK